MERPGATLKILNNYEISVVERVCIYFSKNFLIFLII